MKQSTKEFKSVTIEEYWEEKDSKVFWVWRFANTRKWNRVKTPYAVMPIVKFELSLLKTQKGNKDL